MKKIITILAAVGAAAGLLAGCSSDADVAKHNTKKAADMFEVNRRIVVFNGITDTYLLTVEGHCNIADEQIQLEITCRLPDGGTKVHYAGLSDNVSYFVEQIDAVSVSDDHYRVIFKPEVIVPNVDRP